MNRLVGIPESMLIPLAARSMENNNLKPIITDEISKKIFNSVNYPLENISHSSTTQTGICIRTFILDNIVKSFITQSINPLIINIGCGLDTRYKRLHLDMRKISWIDIDVPEAIEIRKHFFDETDDYKMIAKSMLDFEWISMVQKETLYDESQEILVIFEGVLMYFDATVIKELLERISRSFNINQLSFAIEFCSKTISNNTQRHKSVSKLRSKPKFKYGYNNLSELNSMLPRELNITNEFNYFDYFHKRWGLFGLCRLIPFFKKRLNNKIVIIKN
ncbi:class I SAM-dependent methyltransferase [Staphylococcus roterodami]|nr:class I SAM-dependent methyltransferase [Staphylococcus roterodami]